MTGVFVILAALTVVALALWARSEHRRLRRELEQMEQRHAIEDAALARWKHAVSEHLKRSGR